MVMGMKIVQSQNNTLSLCSVCIEAKITRQPHRDVRPNSSQAGFRLNADLGEGRRTYTTF